MNFFHGYSMSPPRINCHFSAPAVLLHSWRQLISNFLSAQFAHVFYSSIITPQAYTNLAAVLLFRMADDTAVQPPNHFKAIMGCRQKYVLLTVLVWSARRPPPCGLHQCSTQQSKILISHINSLSNDLSINSDFLYSDSVSSLLLTFWDSLICRQNNVAKPD